MSQGLRALEAPSVASSAGAGRNVDFQACGGLHKPDGSPFPHLDFQSGPSFPQTNEPPSQSPGWAWAPATARP